MTFRFELATTADDEGLRSVLRESPMTGEVSLLFLREPSFFEAEKAGNIESQVIAYVHQVTREVAGFGVRSIRSLFVDGQPRRIGYLSALRSVASVRGSGALVHGYEYLRDLHRDRKVPYYITTLFDDNVVAKHALASGRTGLPLYIPHARIITYLIPLRHRVRHCPDAEICGREMLPQAVSCVNDWNRRHQFAPVYDVNDILGNTSLLLGFSSRNLYVYSDGHNVLATLGIWDQNAYKQTMVASYSPRLRLVRPLYNLLAALRGQPSLPKAGERMKFLYACLISAVDNNKEAFEHVLRRALYDWSGVGYDYLCVGLCERHPLEVLVRSLAVRTISSTIYVVHWRDEEVELPCKDIFSHLEIATL